MTEDMEIDGFNLLDFPNEVLLRIFENLDDPYLLDVSRVCTRFESLAKEAFAQKYNGQSENRYFKVSQDGAEDGTLYLPFFEAFGHNMTSLDVQFTEYYMGKSVFWLNTLLKEHCPLVAHLTFSSRCRDFNYPEMLDLMPALTSLTFKRTFLTDFAWAGRRYAKLNSFTAQNTNFEPSALHRFVQFNSQLKNLQLEYCDGLRNPLQILSGALNGLTSLVLKDRKLNSIDSTDVIILGELESLTISMKLTSVVNALGAIARGCRKIKRLELSMEAEQRTEDEDNIEEDQAVEPIGDDEKNRIVNQLNDIIGSFEELTSLSINGFTFEPDFVRTLVQRLPKLKLLHLHSVWMFGFNGDDILFVFTECEHLVEFSISSLYVKPRIDLNFHHQFAKIAQNRGDDITFKYTDDGTKLVVTEGKLMVNGELRYWSGYEANQSRSKTHFLELNEKCIDKIVEFLREDDVSNLYRTCKQLKKVVAKRISAETYYFGVYDIPKARDWLEIIGDDVKKINFDTEGADDEDLLEICNLISEKCGKHLTELKLDYASADVMNGLNLSFPNLEKLAFKGVVSTYPYILPAMSCPKLKHLEIRALEFHNPDGVIGIPVFKISLDNVTVIKIGLFTDIIAKALNTLNENICNQLEEFTVEELAGSHTYAMNKLLANVIMRFRNLTSLHFICPYIERTNTKFLFGRCYKLKKLSFEIESLSKSDGIRQMLLHVKENCKDLEVIQIVREHTEIFPSNIFEYAAELFPDVELKDVSYATNEWDDYTYKIATFNKSGIPKVCERPY